VVVVFFFFVFVFFLFVFFFFFFVFFLFLFFLFFVFCFVSQRKESYITITEEKVEFGGLVARKQNCSKRQRDPAKKKA